MAGFEYIVFLIFLEYVWGARDSEQCGIPLAGGKIVGGVDSGSYRYPWFALLLLKQNTKDQIPICGGSLITQTHVLTAAHCFTIDPTVPKNELFTVALGTYDICNNQESTREIFDVDSVIVHEMYQKRKKFYDIALIKLNRQADFTVICLPLSGVPDLTENALLIGFGVLSEDSNSAPCHMMEVNVTKFSKTDCSNSLLPLEDKTEPSVICAGSLSGNADSCYGDSGGPLQTIDSGGRFVIAGIVSYGYGCATPEIPGIYTNTGSYIQWIREHTSQTLSRKRFKINSFKQRQNTQKKQSMGITFPIYTNSSKLSKPQLDNSNINIQQRNRNHISTKNPVTKRIFFENSNQINIPKNSTVIFRET